MKAGETEDQEPGVHTASQGEGHKDAETAVTLGDQAGLLSTPLPGPRPCYPWASLPALLENLGWQSQSVRRRTQALKEFIHEKTEGPSGRLSKWRQAPEARVATAGRAGPPPVGGGGLAATLGTEEQTQAVLGTEGLSSWPACPGLPPGPHLSVKVQLGGRRQAELGS